MGKHWTIWQLTGSRALTGTNLPWTSLAFTHMHKSKPVKSWCSTFGSRPVLLELLHSRAIWKVWKYQVSHFWALLLICFWHLKSAPTLSCQMHHFNSYTTHLWAVSTKRHHIQHFHLQCPHSGVTNNCAHPNFLSQISQNTIFVHALRWLSLRNVNFSHLPGG